MTGKPGIKAWPGFDNRFVRAMPADPVTGNFSRQVSGALYSRVPPTPVKTPVVLAIAEDVAELLGLDPNALDAGELAQVLSGNKLLAGMEPYASVYGGHQFGNWAGQLGDGRAINLGELNTPHHGNWTLQLKGAGPTPYSRSADGRAVLRSSVREFLCSEAMHHLGVPTTRALSLVLTGDTVVRDMFYDGNPKAEPGAIVCRVAPSFIRFGHFELPAARGDNVMLEQLLHFVIRNDRPDLAHHLSAPDEASRRHAYLQWFAGVCSATQEMVVHWMRVGFVHGVMNTDNMSVLGLTIDYGPYGWIDDYDPDWTPNTTDAGQRRYRFGQQAAVARWNLYQLANALYPLVQDADALQAILDSLKTDYNQIHDNMMANKLGLPQTATQHPEFASLLSLLDKLLRSQAIDMTLFFRCLSAFASTHEVNAGQDATPLQDFVSDAFYPAVAELNSESEPDSAAEVSADTALLFQQWEALYRQFLSAYPLKSADRQKQMAAANPAFVLRNYLVQQAIDDLEQGDRREFDTLMRVLRTPYNDLQGADVRLGSRRPEWARQRAGCSMLSCSS